MTNQRTKAIQKIIELSKKYNISVDEISNSLTTQDNHSKYVKVFLYIGAIVIATSVMTLISHFWLEIPDSLKILAVMGTGIVAYLAMISLTYHSEYSVTTPFAIFSAIAMTLGIFLALSLLFPDSPDTRPTIITVCLFMALQQFFTFVYLRLTSPLFFVILFTSVAYLAAASLLELNSNLVFFILGISYIYLSLYLFNTAYAAIVFLGFFFGSATTNLSYYLFTHQNLFEPAITILMAIQLYLGITVKSKTLVFVNVIGLMLYLGDLTTRLFNKSLSWLITISIVGVVLMIFAVKKIKPQT